MALTRELLLSPDSRSACYYDLARVGEFLEGRGAFEGISMLTVWKVSMYLVTLELLHREYP